jgi:hypothetical protein
MKLVLGGGSSSSSKHKEHRSTSSSPPPRPTAAPQGQYSQGQYGSQYTEPGKSSEQERAEYLASIDQGRGAHVAGVGGPGSHAYASGRGRDEEEGEDVPTAPVLVSNSCFDVDCSAQFIRLGNFAPPTHVQASWSMCCIALTTKGSPDCTSPCTRCHRCAVCLSFT